MNLPPRREPRSANKASGNGTKGRGACQVPRGEGRDLSVVHERQEASLRDMATPRSPAGWPDLFPRSTSGQPAGEQLGDPNQNPANPAA